MRQRLGRIFEIIVILWVFTVVCAQFAKADSYMTAGLGVASSGKNSLAESKFFNFGYRSNLFLDITQETEFGFWTDTAGEGRKGSGYFAYRIGVEVDHPIILCRVMAGPAFITSPDAYLGGMFPQFSETLSAGFKDSRGRAIVGKYTHFSSAGFYQPNVGRDFGSVEASIPW